MKYLGALAAACAPLVAYAGEPAWEFSITGYWNKAKDEDGYASAIAIASRGPLHVEARANYEAIHAQSLFIGWTFEAGDEVKLEARPIAGFVGHALRGTILGFEASVSGRRQWDYYIEVERVQSRTDGTPDYTYAWSELGWRPIEPLRVGIVGQRTRVHGAERDYLGGGFVQLTYGKATLGAYWFNPGSPEQLVTVSLGAAF
jgi:hypothetical protein